MSNTRKATIREDVNEIFTIRLFEDNKLVKTFRCADFGYNPRTKSLIVVSIDERTEVIENVDYVDFK